MKMIGEKVREIHALHPDWSAMLIAKTLNVTPWAVRGAAHRSRLVLPSEHLRLERVRGVTAGSRKGRFKRVRYAGKDVNDKGGW